MSAAEWKKRCEAEWALQGAPMPDNFDWKSVYEAKPLGRNLLKNPAPLGLSKDTPPPELKHKFGPPPPHFQSIGDYTGWTTSTEVLPYDTSGIPKGAAICEMPKYSWFTLEQFVDLKAEGLWEELLDDFQPKIFIEDWHEESQIDDSIYHLHVKLLAADKSTESTMQAPPRTEELSHTTGRRSHMCSLAMDLG